MRIVFDTSVLVAAARSRHGASMPCFRACRTLAFSRPFPSPCSSNIAPSFSVLRTCCTGPRLKRTGFSISSSPSAISRKFTSFGARSCQTRMTICFLNWRSPPMPVML